LSEDAHPGAKLWNSTTNPFSADVEEDWSCFGIEIIPEHPVPLIEVLLRAVVIVVDYLGKPVQFLVVDDVVFEIGGFSVEGVVLGIVPG
jgi:hypothetical protein